MGLVALGSIEEFEAEEWPNVIEGFKDASGAEYRLTWRGPEWRQGGNQATTVGLGGATPVLWPPSPVLSKVFSQSIFSEAKLSLLIKNQEKKKRKKGKDGGREGAREEGRGRRKQKVGRNI